MVELSPSARALLDEVVSMSTDLDLHHVLSRLVGSACRLTEARYGALGVLGAAGGLDDFIVHGIDPEARRRIGEPPHGRGILGLLTDEARPLRLDDLGRHPLSSGFPENHPPMTTFLGAPLYVQGNVYGNIYLAEKAGGARFTEEDEELLVLLADAAGFMVDNARTYGLGERRRDWLEATAKLDDALQPPLSENEALKQVTSVLRSVSGASATAVLQAPSAGDLVATAVDGPEPDAVGAWLDQAEASGALLAPATVSPFAVSREGARTVVLPIQSALSDSRLFLLVIYGVSRPLPDPHELGLLQGYAEHAALALDRLRAVEERKELALVSDRERIARDLHDVVLQRLFATGMQLQALLLSVAGEELVIPLDNAIDSIDATIKEIRATIFALGPRGPGSLRDRLAVVRGDLSLNVADDGGGGLHG